MSFRAAIFSNTRMRTSSRQIQTTMAKLALARACKRTSRVVIETDNQLVLIELLRALDPKAVLSLSGANGIRIHPGHWGERLKPETPERTCKSA